nr:N-acetyltransferase 1 [Gloriosa superba]
MEPRSNSPLPPPAITLRPFVISDADAAIALRPFVPLDADADAPYTRTEDTEDYIRHRILPHPWYRAICVAGDSRPVGSISIQAETAFGADRRASVAYVVSRDWRGRGVATAALKAAAGAVFSHWPHLVRLEAVADVENRASQRVLEKAGFLKEGVLRKYMAFMGEPRDMVMYSFVPTDISPV